ncbi:hypothetical protein CJD36_006660 [Flavipsychrobacter stenotrophus]|uniref:DUF4846 domain-containing protein n=1 Tax=Flavipsychrobacter stenotrophus TaxID=2077091 RepID=A0A2S7SXN8_9BACT|nr:DUF4846 domain-containing protein [Flavipsychrobacter stenotrophus]PQJ11478.1 hypothetical protein CJD36_006660 [Flavipsychrobacter stenotrophus]
MKYTSLLLSVFLLHSCQSLQQKSYLNPLGRTIKERVLLPEGYTRIVGVDTSFATYLQNVPLLAAGEKVHYFDGSVKDKPDVYVAVIDMPIGHKDLQQCADVAMHMRAAYLYKVGMQDSIRFTLTNGFVAAYSKWAHGYRIAVKGNKTEWVKSVAARDDSATLGTYMDVIYSYCGSLSLSRELTKIGWRDVRPGDLLVRGGTPGHVELVMDMAHDKSGHKIYLLAQGFMPAQQMQLLANPMNSGLSPWYELKEGEIRTPECVFTSEHFMRF